MEPLTVQGTMHSLKEIAEYVKAAMAIAGLSKKAAYKLRLAVDEIATNAIIHGYGGADCSGADCSGFLRCHAKLDEQTLTIFLEDTGFPYDPTKQATPNHLDLPPDDRPEGDLGVYLAINSVDKFIYERNGDWNRNIFIVKLGGSADDNSSTSSTNK